MFWYAGAQVSAPGWPQCFDKSVYATHALWTWSLGGIEQCFQQLSIKFHVKHIEICYPYDARCIAAMSIQADHLHRFA